MAATDSSTSVDTRGAEGPAGEVAVAAAKIHDVSAGQVLAQEWLDAFARSLESGDASAIERLFLPNGYWRDILALHWDLRTFTGCANIAKAWGGALKRHRQRNPPRGRQGRGVRAKELGGDRCLSISKPISRCRGHLRLLAPADKTARNG
jgi:hypothetical protein